MDKCPHCNEQLKIPNRAYHNASTYGNTYHVTTECCNKMIKIIPKRSYLIEIGDTSRQEDDWGVPIGPAGEAYYNGLADRIAVDYIKYKSQW